MSDIRVPMRRLMAAGAATVLLSVSAVMGCRGQEERHDRPLHLRVGFGMGPSARLDAVAVLTSILYAEGLVTHDWNGHTNDALVDSWSWSNARTTLHLRLKDGVRFHDDSVLNADTVVRFLKQRASLRGLGFMYAKEITATGKLTVDIHLSRPDAFLLPELSDIRLTHPDKPDIGTGPFRLVSRAPIETVRFEQYHGGAPALSGINISVYDSQRSAWAALMKGEVDVVQEVSRESVEFMKGSSTVRPFSTVQPFYVPIVLNHAHAALRNSEVRRAMIEALDRQGIIDQAMKGFGQVADGPIWPLHWAYTPPKVRHHYDPPAARARLDRAGFPMRSQPNGPNARFSFRCLVWSEDPQYERIALMVQRQLFDVGIDMVIEMATLDAIGTRVVSGAFDGLLVRVNSSRTLNITYQFWRSRSGDDPPNFNTGYRGTNAAFDRFRLAGSDEETRAAVAELVNRFHEDVPALFIAWLEVARAVDTRFDVGDSKTPDPFANIWQWRPVKRMN